MQKLWKSLFERMDLIVLLSCLLFTYFAWSLGQKNDQSQILALESKNHDVITIVRNELTDIFTFIDGVGGLYTASEQVSIEELATYMRATSQDHLNGEVMRISFVAKMPNKQMEEYQKNVRRDGPIEYVSKIASGYDEQFVVTQTVDKTGKVYPMSGLNLLNDPDRRLLVEEIVAGSEAAVVHVPKILTVPEYTGAGFIFAVPVVKEGQLIGFVTAVVSQEQLSGQINAVLSEKFGWKWYQNTELLGEKIIGFSNVLRVSGTIVVTPIIDWKIELQTPKETSLIWNIVLASGVLFSFLIYMVVYSLTSATIRGNSIAQSMTTDLVKYKLALDSANNHIVITDIDGKVLYANAAAQKMTGYGISEIIGKTPRLWGGTMGQSFYASFWKAIKTDKQVFNGLFANKRKNGELYTAEATVSPITSENGELVGFVGVEEDVTEERKILKEREDNLAKLAKFNQLMLGRELKMVELKKNIKELTDQLNAK